MSDERKFCENLYEQHLKNISGIRFTRRQVDVMACLLHVWGDKEIAKQLGISPNTVSVHINAIIEKLGVSGRRSIINFIEKSGRKKELKDYFQYFTSNGMSKKNQSKNDSSFSILPPAVLLKRKEKRRRLTLIFSCFF